jgi:hypothetical protein
MGYARADFNQAAHPFGFDKLSLLDLDFAGHFIEAGAELAEFILGFNSSSVA